MLLPNARNLVRTIPARPSRAFLATHTSPSNFVKILECGARDGLQNEPSTVPTAVKAELIRRLAATGLKYIEAGAFVPPKWVPQVR